MFSKENSLATVFLKNIQQKQKRMDCYKEEIDEKDISKRIWKKQYSRFFL